MNQNDQLKKLIELTKSKVVSIKNVDSGTLIEFENGEVLPLVGGSFTLENVEFPKCSFCGREQTENFPLIGPPDRDFPLICSKCTSIAMETFIKHNIEVEIDISHLYDSLKNTIFNTEKDKN